MEELDVVIGKTTTSGTSNQRLFPFSRSDPSLRTRTTYIASPTEDLAFPTQVQVEIPVDHFETVDQLFDVDVGETGSGVFVGLVRGIMGSTYGKRRHVMMQEMDGRSER